MNRAHLAVAVITTLQLLGWAARPSSGEPIPVSPGGADGSGRIEGPCPTYSWETSAGAVNYELAVYDVSESERRENGDAARSRDPVWMAPMPVVRVVLPGTFDAWTPGPEHCLEAGRTYAWSVRSRNQEGRGEWSDDVLFFRVAEPLLPADVEAALRLVGRYLESCNGLWPKGVETLVPGAAAPTPGADRAQSQAASGYESSLVRAVAARCRDRGPLVVRRAR